MNEDKDLLFDLLTKKAVYGLDEADQRALDELDPAIAERELATLELTAAAISMTGLDTSEPLPAHLRKRIGDEAGNHIDAGVATSAESEPWPPAKPAITYDEDDTRSSSGWFGWLGWAAAAAACIALGLNIWFTQIRPLEAPIDDQVRVEPPRPPTMAEIRDEMVRSGGKLIKAEWAPGNVKDIKDVSGDIVWNEEKQSGYIRFRALPVNDAATTCYQLWIFDKTQDKATPIDGGIFDVNADGEVIVEIKAKLKAVGPEMFAITVERHGGVVVSKREKVAALAKVETRSV